MRATSEGWSHYCGVCQSAGQKARHRDREEQEERVSRENEQERIWINHTVPCTPPPWRSSFQINLISGFATVACCKSWINVAHVSPAGPLLWVIYYGVIWQLACKSPLWGSVPWRNTGAMCYAIAECFTTCSVLQMFLSFSLKGLLLNSLYKVAGAKNTSIKQKSRLDKVGCPFLLCSLTVCPLKHFVPPYGAGRRLPNTAGVIWCQQTINGPEMDSHSAVLCW